MLLLTLTAAANQYAVDAARVVEVIPKVELRTIPHAPAALAGFLSYRGGIVAVIDLNLLLGGRAAEDRLSTRIVLVDDRIGDHNFRKHDESKTSNETDVLRTTPNPVPGLLGLVAEQVTDLAYAQPELIVPSPIALPNAPYLGGLFQTDGGIIQLIVIEQIRAAVLQSISQGQGAALELTSQASPSIA